jgi:hypothetical protein
MSNPITQKSPEIAVIEAEIAVVSQLARTHGPLQLAASERQAKLAKEHYNLLRRSDSEQLVSEASQSSTLTT